MAKRPKNPNKVYRLKFKKGSNEWFHFVVALDAADARDGWSDQIIETKFIARLGRQSKLEHGDCLSCT